MKQCEFEIIEPGVVQCQGCGRRLETQFRPDQLHLICGPNHAGEGQSRSLLDHIAQKLYSRKTCRPDGRCSVPALRTIEEVREIVETHCQPCEMFRSYCTALTGCSKVLDYHTILTSPVGRCPRGVW